MSSLRVGFLVSGLLHVAVVAAFTQSSREPAPVAEQSRPLTMKLAVFEPPPPAPGVRPQDVDQPPATVAEQSVEPVKAVLETAPPEPLPVVKRTKSPAVAKQAIEPKPRPVEKRAVTAQAKRPRTAAPVRRAQHPTVAAAPVAVERPPPVTIDVEAKQHYLAALAAQIDRRKYYPRAARRLGEEGRVVVHFVIQRNGELTDLRVTESSGSPRLDEAALKTLRRVTPFKPIPVGFGSDQWPISVPITFSLRG
jgi:protein TonB